MSIKKPLIFISTAFIPFILVWMGFILTGFAFNPREIFQSNGFWFISVVYFLVWLMICPLIAEGINQIFSNNKN